MRGMGTDHVISGPMRGLKTTAPNSANRQTDRQTDIHSEFTLNRLIVIYNKQQQKQFVINRSPRYINWLRLEATGWGCQAWATADRGWQPLSRSWCGLDIGLPATGLDLQLLVWAGNRLLGLKVANGLSGQTNMAAKRGYGFGS